MTSFAELQGRSTSWQIQFFVIDGLVAAGHITKARGEALRAEVIKRQQAEDN